MTDSELNVSPEMADADEATATPPNIPESIELAILPMTDARVRVLPTRLEFVGDLTFEQWREGLRLWQQASIIYHCGLADLINYGRKQFGDEKVDETLEFFAFDFADVMKAHAIGQLSLELRVVELTSEHYYVLSKSLPGATKEQGKWAAIAAKEKLSPSELKASIEKGKLVRQSQIEQDRGSGSGVPNIQGLSLVFQRWEKQVGGEAQILAQSKDWKEKFLQEVHPIVDLAHKVEETLGEGKV